MQRNAGELPVFLEALIQTEDERLDGGVGEAVSSRGKNIGDCRVNVGVVAGIPAELPPHGLCSHNVWQIIPKHYDLKQTKSKSELILLTLL